MRSRTTVASITLAVILLAGPAAAAKRAVADRATFTVALTGDAEATKEAAPALGDTDGLGSVKLVVDLASNQICYEFRLSKVATPLMAHIHRAPQQHRGPSVVTLFTGPGGELRDCVMWTEERLEEIVSEPSNFYVNLYTTEYPDGALRGQLSS